MARSLHKYTVVEGQNVGLGQAGSVFSNTTDNLTPVSGHFVAITVIEDAAFTTLVSADGAGINFIGTTASSAGSGNGNEAITNGVTFSAGTTIYGRWNSITLNGGSIVAYLG